MAVRFVVLFLEGALVQLLQAESAHEMLRVEFLEHGRYAAAGDRFGTTGAKRSSFRVIVGLAVGQALVVEERSAKERLTTVPAHETIRMPLTVQSRNIILHDGPVAPVALRCKHVEVIITAVRLPVALVESILAELLTALGAEKVLRVPSFLQRRYAFIQNRSIAVGTTWAEQIVIIRLAVRVSVTLEEVPGAQLLIAVIASKMLRMPSFAESRYDLADDGLIAGIAAPLLSGIDSLATHIGLQISKHGIQLITCRGQLFGRSHRRQSTLIMRGSLVWLRVIRHRLQLMRSGSDLEIREGSHQIIQFLGGRRSIVGLVVLCDLLLIQLILIVGTRSSGHFFRGCFSHSDSDLPTRMWLRVWRLIPIGYCIDWIGIGRTKFIKQAVHGGSLDGVVDGIW